MEVLVTAGVVAALVSVLALVRVHRRNVDRLSSPQHDMRRAGTDGRAPGAAGPRATGTNAWMRPGGF